MGSEHSNRGAKRAREAREALGLAAGGPVADVVEAIERAGDAHVVVLDLPEAVAGAYLANPGCPLLLVNGRQPLTRQRFTVAHELGHHRMGHATVVDEAVVIRGRSHDPKEICANAFAAELLMPRASVAAWGGENVRGAVTLEHVVLLAGEYGVSAQAARYALSTAAVLRDERRACQLDEEIAAEMHVELAGRLGVAPFEDELAGAAGRLPRLPGVLRRSALGDLLAGEIDVEGMAARTGREPAEVEAMLADLGIDRLLPARAGSATA